MRRDSGLPFGFHFEFCVKVLIKYNCLNCENLDLKCLNIVLVTRKAKVLWKSVFKTKAYPNEARGPRQDDNNIITSNVENQSTAESNCETSVSASARKINLGNREMPELNKSEVSGYRFVNLEILGTIFKLLPCKECHECQLMLIEDDSQCMGCTSCLSVWCSSC
jgi:hypothetical protein